jgi:hypothetical protein
MTADNLWRVGFVRDALPRFSHSKLSCNKSANVKMKPFGLCESFASGLSTAPMAKEIGIAAELSRELQAKAEWVLGTSLLWNEASRLLGPVADYRTTHKHLSENAFRSKELTAGSG